MYIYMRPSIDQYKVEIEYHYCIWNSFCHQSMLNCFAVNTIAALKLRHPYNEVQFSRYISVIVGVVSYMSFLLSPSLINK